MAPSSSNAGGTLREMAQQRTGEVGGPGEGAVGEHEGLGVRTRGWASPEEAEDIPGSDIVPLLDDDEREQNRCGHVAAALCAGKGSGRGEGGTWPVRLPGGDSRRKPIATSNIVKPPKKPKAWDGIARLSRAGGRAGSRWQDLHCEADERQYNRG